MRLQIRRRTFLKGSAAAVTAAALSGCRRPGDALAVPPERRRVPGYCEVCFWKCGLFAHVEGEEVVFLEGNPASPNNNGRLCARGNAGIGFLDDPDRLRSPMRRVGPRGSGRFEEITWDEALGEVASRLRAIVAEQGAEAVALFSHGSGGKYFTTLMQALGSPNYAQPSYAQCRGPRDEGYRLTFGTGLGSPEPTDLARARFILLIGSHLGENMHLLQAQEFAEAVSRGAQIAVADPRFSVAASKARWWLPVRPGSDQALLLALIHTVIEEKLYDREFVARHAVGLEELAAGVADKDAEWAQFRTDIPASTIREIARAMAAAKPAVLIHPGRHATWYGQDVQRARAMAILTALMGAWGREGGILVPAAVPLAKVGHAPPFPEPRRGAADGAGTTYPFATDGIASGLRDATQTGNPYPLKAWLVSGTNLIKTLPNEAETLEAIAKLDLLVTVDILPSEIVAWSDIVLPECTYLERWDSLNAPAFRRSFVGLRAPAVSARHDTRSAWRIARDLGHALGLGAWFPFASQEQELREQAEASGLDWRQLLRDGVVVAATESGTTEAPEFDTPSRKIELWSKQLADAGFDPVPLFYDTPAPPAGYVRLIYGRAPIHSFGRTQNNRYLSALMPENAAWLSPATAEAWGVHDGERVVLENQDGARTGPIAAKVTQRVRDDVLYMVNGFGHQNPAMRRAWRRGGADSALITRYETDPLMGGTGMRVNFVRVARG
jgi:thiosulfate reductase / polysulfide reductase chain A